ncbi:7-carboxy-7-deazaguanine synthase QueE [Persephonella sp.]
MEKFNVVEIFSSIEGEGSLIGYPVTFIRLEGCNLRCEWCDTTYSYDGKTFIQLSIDEILNEIKKYPNKKVCLTGGEPFFSENINKLIDEILKNRYQLIIETNGTVFPKNLYDIYKKNINRIHTVVSPKPDAFYMINKDLLPYVSEFKFVVDKYLSVENILTYKEFYTESPLILQPESNLPEMIKKAIDIQKELLIDHNIEARVIPQCHKYMGLL